MWGQRATELQSEFWIFAYIMCQRSPQNGYFSGFGTWGVSTNPSVPFPFPLPPLPLSPSFPPEAGGCCAKVGGINPPEGVWETPCHKTQRSFFSRKAVVEKASVFTFILFNQWRSIFHHRRRRRRFCVHLQRWPADIAVSWMWRYPVDP